MFFSCIEPYHPDIKGYEDLLVVDALITDRPGPYKVKLARSCAYNRGIAKNVHDADVKIVDQHGNEYIFYEVTIGLYQNIDSSFIGESGNAYQLSITTKEGKEYKSDFQLMKPPVEIDSLYYKFDPGHSVDEYRVQIYIDTHDANNNSKFYCWTFEETWKFAVPYQRKQSKDTLKICYASYESKEFIIGSSEQNKVDQLIMYPLNSISYNTNRLKYRYSILMYQYSLNENFYRYIKQLKEINEQGGSLFDVAPTVTRGNVKNVNDETETVLGFFQVSSISEKRIFIDNKDLPYSNYVSTGFEFCERTIVSAAEADSIAEARHLVIFDTLTVDIVLLPSVSCFDCRKSGSLTKPEFWID